MIARHIGNVETEIGLDHWPNIYCGVAVFIFLPAVSRVQEYPCEGKGGILRTAPDLFRELFHQRAELYLAWLSLSEQSSVQTVLHLYLPDAVYLLPGIYVSG